MSGDVQPRRRKDKKKKKDELGVEEPRGTAAVFGDGDVFIHSQHDHGTGGHWCAKIIFFSLLAVLVTLIGLIILENRGLSEFEASVVESQYSGFLEGWLEDAPEDDHHDEHTLELKHHDNEDDDEDTYTYNNNAHDNEEDHQDKHEKDDEDDDNDSEIDNKDGDEDKDEINEDDEGENDDDNNQQEEESQEQNLEMLYDEEDDEEHYFSKYYESSYKPNNDDDDDDNKDNYNESDDDDDKENDQSYDRDKTDNDGEDADNLSTENDEDEDNLLEDDDDEHDNYHDKLVDDDDDDEYDNENDQKYDQKDEDDSTAHSKEIDDDHEEDEKTEETDVEKTAKDLFDVEPVSNESPELLEDDNVFSEENEDFKSGEEDEEDKQDEFLESNEDDEPPLVEPITAPTDKPLEEVEESTSSEKPPDTLKEEEEYEKRQEELRREEAQASHMWLKLVVGGALLAATHAVVRRASTSRDMPERSERSSRGEIPTIIDRRMTLIPEEEFLSVTPQKISEVSRPQFSREVKSKVPLIIESASPDQESEEELEVEKFTAAQTSKAKNVEDKELYSDDEEIEEEIVEPPKKEIVKQITPTETRKTPERQTMDQPEEEMLDDVEIVDDEQLEEELEDEGDEEEEDISDVDDAELLSRLEAKYGRLPEPERSRQRNKDGGNSIDDDWYDEPSDPQWRQHLNQAEEELRRGELEQAMMRAQYIRENGIDCARRRWIYAVAVDKMAEKERSNRLLHQTIKAYQDVFKVGYHISDKKLIEISQRALNRIQFAGWYLDAEPVYKTLMRRFPNNVTYWNKLCESFLMANRPSLAEETVKGIFKRWPDDRLAWAHYGFVLKTMHNNQEKAVEAFTKALDGDELGPANQARFYYHLGDSLLLLGRYEEAHNVHKRGAKLGHFLSPAQRSLYNAENLRSKPWWNIKETPFLKLAEDLESNWKDILKEGKAALALYEEEKEGLKEKGKWSQLDLFVRGKQIPGRCMKVAPVTCSVVRKVDAAVKCHRGQIKFSAMEAGTHVRPHVGPTNCRLRMHLGLSNTKNTYIRVNKETRQWQEGKVLMFDDSFEHEVWHNGTGTRLILIVDVWHPDIPRKDWNMLPPI